MNNNNNNYYYYYYYYSTSAAIEKNEGREQTASMQSDLNIRNSRIRYGILWATWSYNDSYTQYN